MANAKRRILPKIPGSRAVPRMPFPRPGRRGAEGSSEHSCAIHCRGHHWACAWRLSRRGRPWLLSERHSFASGSTRPHARDVQHCASNESACTRLRGFDRGRSISCSECHRHFELAAEVVVAALRCRPAVVAEGLVVAHAHRLHCAALRCAAVCASRLGTTSTRHGRTVLLSMPQLVGGERFEKLQKSEKTSTQPTWATQTMLGRFHQSNFASSHCQLTLPDRQSCKRPEFLSQNSVIQQWVPSRVPWYLTSVQ